MKNKLFIGFLTVVLVIIGACSFPERDKDTNIITFESSVGGLTEADDIYAKKDVVVTIYAYPDIGYVFREWQVISGDIILSGTTANPATFNMPPYSVTIKATFEPVMVPVSVMNTEWIYNGNPQGANVDYDGGVNEEKAGILSVIYINKTDDSDIYKNTSPINAGIYDIYAATTGGTEHIAFPEMFWVGTLTISPKELQIIGVTAENRDFLTGDTNIVITGGKLVGVEDDDDVNPEIPLQVQWKTIMPGMQNLLF